jgi:hypothetical protein
MKYINNVVKMIEKKNSKIKVHSGKGKKLALPRNK